jgi:hypothetical protein
MIFSNAMIFFLQVIFVIILQISAPDYREMDITFSSEPTSDVFTIRRTNYYNIVDMSVYNASRSQDVLIQELFIDVENDDKIKFKKVPEKVWCK